MNLLDYSILNVDDYRPSLYARSKVLRQAGFEVLEATNGAGALQMLSDLKPPLVLLDVNLPDMTGFEVCKRIRATPTIAGTTVVHISASSSQTRHQVYGLDSGADSYMVEPVEPEVLIATVKAFLRARQAEDALRRSNEDLGRFSYTVAHELSEPLRTITVHAQLLETEAGRPAFRRNRGLIPVCNAKRPPDADVHGRSSPLLPCHPSQRQQLGGSGHRSSLDPSTLQSGCRNPKQGSARSRTILCRR